MFKRFINWLFGSPKYIIEVHVNEIRVSGEIKLFKEQEDRSNARLLSEEGRSASNSETISRTDDEALGDFETKFRNDGIRTPAVRLGQDKKENSDA